MIGDRRKYLVALLTLNASADRDRAEEDLRKYIEEMNLGLPSFETIKAFRILPRDFSVEGGELTPTLKVRRSFIQEKYRSLVDGLYGAETHSQTKPISAVR